jgi:uracil-DNA glycosylase
MALQIQAQLKKENSKTGFPENLPMGWRERLKSEKNQKYFLELAQFLKLELQGPTPIFPPKEKMLRALQLVDFDSVRVVILGQDPYHGFGQAMGLSFAVPNSLKPKPPSLLNIFKELKGDLGLDWNGEDSELTGWAAQGVLMLNTILSVRSGEPLSHSQKGWEIFTDRVIELLAERKDPVLFFLWGANAQRKSELIKAGHHFLLKAPHPSPLSAHRGFLGCRHFSQANEILRGLGKAPVDWTRINEQ